MTNNAAIWYNQEAFDVDGPALYGRRVAGHSFLSGFIRHSGVEDFYCFANNKLIFDNFVQTFLKKEQKSHYINSLEIEKLSDIGTLYFPVPNIVDPAWARARVGSNKYSICGITHTTSSDNILTKIADVLSAPVEEWDAIICTSKCVLDTVNHLISANKDYLKKKFNAKNFTLPKFPIIPLGIDYNKFAISKYRKNKLRSSWREKMKIKKDDVAILYLGRFSFLDKANPFPMLVALEDIARTSKNDVFLIMSGWFQDKSEHELFSNELKRLAPTIKVCLVDGRNKLVQEGIWHAADIFTSLSDNIQETFGITPIEAMASGLPVVISDWNGYKDTVRKGIDGFMVETVMPLNGEKFSQYYQSNSDYMKYVGLTSQVIGVSVGGCINAYKDLINNKELRLQMGKNAQDNAKQFDWSFIVPKYQELWKELSDIRKSSNNNFTAVKPCYEDPFVLFGSYPTINLSYNHTVKLVSGTNMDYLNYVKKSPLVGFIIDEGALSPKQEDVELIYSIIMDYLPHCINEFESKMTKEQYEVLLLNLSWLYKMGLIEVVNSEMKGS